MDESRTETLKFQWFHILMALAAQDLHGNGIIRAVLEQSSDNVRLWPVMLYRSLDDLMAREYIVELKKDRPVGESGRKRFFRITEGGLRALSRETERLGSLVDVARDRISRFRRAVR